MKLSLATIAGLVALVSAKIQLGNSAIDPVAGEDFELTWIEAEGPVTIQLVYGPETNLNKGPVIISDLEPETGSYTWSVPEDLVRRSDYAFYITDGVTENYSLQFTLEGTGVESTSAAPTTASSTVASSTEVTSSATTEEASSTLTTTVTSEVSSSAEPSETESESESSATASTTPTNVPDSKAGRIASPVALIFTLAAMVYFH